MIMLRFKKSVIADDSQKINSLNKNKNLEYLSGTSGSQVNLQLLFKKRNETDEECYDLFDKHGQKMP